jgi:hypothetical protein
MILKNLGEKRNNKMIMKQMLKSEYYPRIMFLLITVTLILIFFNIGNIYVSANVGKNDTKSFIGFAVLDNQTNNSNSNMTESSQLYSEKTYAMFYLYLIAVVGFISLIFVVLILPRIKNWT